MERPRPPPKQAHGTPTPPARSNGKGRRVTLHTATFEGRLRNTDPAAFSACLVEGIGPSKAYGCGLLTLAPSRSGAN
ncbi:type I-E CRISPR-associated protein Cas6/Cse3/CasE [Streptomyces sp. ISL-99]|uniref:type I-E CRISPR-associated protein Cas6/Cse3/CasE n=1 Tax=Streptomyces sp. ISL-99 TaxID=2819193 RepID=UPI0035ADE1F7